MSNAPSIAFRICTNERTDALTETASTFQQKQPVSLRATREEHSVDEGLHTFTPSIFIRHAWMDKASCREIGTEVFYPETSTASTHEQQVDAAVSICRRCAVINECLEYALETRDSYAILGGRTPEQRSVMLRKRTRSHD